MKIFIGMYILFFLSNSYAASMPKDMVTLCSVDDGQLDNISDFPRWTPAPGSALFVSFNNLTTQGTKSHKECNRMTSISGSMLENKGDVCDFSVTDPIGWSLHLSSLVSGTIIFSNGVELTYFDSELSPQLGGSVFLAGDVTRLCRRTVMGEPTDEIILEVQNSAGGWYDYIILDEYPSNI